MYHGSPLLLSLLGLLTVQRLVGWHQFKSSETLFEIEFKKEDTLDVSGLKGNQATSFAGTYFSS